MSNIIQESSRGIDLIPIEDEFLKQRKIFLTESVSSETMSKMIKQLMYLEEVEKSEITIYINSPGGAVEDGLAVYDVISDMESPVTTVCIGTCASMGAILFLAGDKRQMRSHGKIMIHDPAFGGKHEMGGKKPHEIQMELDDLNKCRESLARIIAERCNKPIEEIYEITANDTYYSAEEALDFGLATEIIGKEK